MEIESVKNSTQNVLKNLGEKMKLRTIKTIWIPFLFLSIFSLICPSQIVSKTAKTSKTTKTQQKVEASKKTESPQATQTIHSSLQSDAQSAVLMDGLTGEILYEQ